MKIFLSWSGEQSREAANMFNDWLPGINPCFETFISTDMDRGTLWFPQLNEELKQCSDRGVLKK